MAIVRITDDLIKGMKYRLSTIRKPEEDALVNARPVDAMITLYNYVMPESIIKIMNSLPSRMRPEPIRNLMFQISYTGHTTALTETDIGDGKIYPLSCQSWKSERVGPFNVGMSTITLIQESFQREGSADDELAFDEVESSYAALIEYGRTIQSYKLETEKMRKTLEQFMSGQPSLNKALVAMPSMNAFVPPEYKAKLAEVVERKRRTPAAPKTAEDNAPATNNVDADALTQLVMTAASTRV